MDPRFSSISQQIFLWDTTVGTLGEIYQITFGNNESRHPSIDGSGNLITFSSDASDLIANDANEYEDIFAHAVDSNETWLISMNEFKQQTNGPSEKPIISGDGNFVAFESSASNMVRERGISVVTVETGGAGYFGNPQIVVNDANFSGSGAVLSTEPLISMRFCLTEFVCLIQHGLY